MGNRCCQFLEIFAIDLSCPVLRWNFGIGLVNFSFFLWKELACCILYVSLLCWQNVLQNICLKPTRCFQCFGCVLKQKLTLEKAQHGRNKRFPLTRYICTCWTSNAGKMAKKQQKYINIIKDLFWTAEVSCQRKKSRDTIPYSTSVQYVKTEKWRDKPAGEKWF